MFGPYYFFYLLIYFIYLFIVCTWRAVGSFGDWVLPFHCFCPRDWTQVVRTQLQALLVAEPLLFYFWDRIPHSLDWPQTCSAAKDDLWTSNLSGAHHRIMFYGVLGLHARQALYSRAISPADFCSSEMESHCEAQAGLSLVAIMLQPLECWG